MVSLGSPALICSQNQSNFYASIAFASRTFVTRECILGYFGSMKTATAKCCPLCKTSACKRDIKEIRQFGELMELVKRCLVDTPPSPKPAKRPEMKKDAPQPVIDICEESRMGPPRTLEYSTTSSARYQECIEVSNSRSEMTCSNSRLFDTMFGMRSRQGADRTKDDKPDVRIGTSGVPSELLDDIMAFKLKFSIKHLTGTSAGGMTHMVVQPLTDTQGKYMPRTYRTLLAVVQGVPVVEYRWVRDCVAAGKLLPAEDYKVLRDRVSGDGIALSLRDKVNRSSNLGAKESVCWV